MEERPEEVGHGFISSNSIWISYEKCFSACVAEQSQMPTSKSKLILMLCAGALLAADGNLEVKMP